MARHRITRTTPKATKAKPAAKVTEPVTALPDGAFRFRLTGQSGAGDDRFEIDADTLSLYGPDDRPNPFVAVAMPNGKVLRLPVRTNAYGAALGYSDVTLRVVVVDATPAAQNATTAPQEAVADPIMASLVAGGNVAGLAEWLRAERPKLAKAAATTIAESMCRQAGTLAEA